MKYQINMDNQNAQQIGQNPVSQAVQIQEKPKTNFWFISSVLLFVILITLGIWFAISINSKSKLLRDQQLTISDQTNQNAIPKNWTTYKGDGLSFRYEPEWIVESPNKVVFGNEKIWKISRKDAGNMSSIMFISRVRKYDPMPGYVDSLRSYLDESKIVGEGKSKYAKDILINARKAIRYTYPGSKTEWNDDTLVIDIPEVHELLLINFHAGWTTTDTWNPEAFNESVKKYFDPFLQSLEISSTSWPQLGTYLSNISNNNLNTSDWQKYQAPNYTLFHPSYWNTRYKDIDGVQTLVLTKTGGQTIEGELELPQIFIGSPEIFSTSGALCANAGQGECEEVGQVEIKVKERTYSAPIIKKKLFKNGQLTESYYYVVQVSLNRVHTAPNTVTTIFKDQSEGQEIVDVLSTISY